MHCSKTPPSYLHYATWIMFVTMPIHKCLHSNPSPDNNTSQQPNKNTLVANQLLFLGTNHQIDKIPIYTSISYHSRFLFHR